MKRAFLILSTLALAACGDNLLGGDDTTDPTNPDPEPERRIDASGTYRLHSTFDIATNMPGGSGTFVNSLIAATDDPDDPMSWLLDQMIGTMQPGTFKSALQIAKPFVAGYLNDKLGQLAPELVDTVRDVGQRMNTLTKNFGVNEKLAIYEADQQYLATITADTVRFKLDATTHVDAEIDDVTAAGVHVTYTNHHLDIGDHALALPYNQIVRLGLDVAIIPAIDPTAHDLTSLLDNVVDCQAVGTTIADALDLGSAAFWKSVCLSGLAQAADYVYDRIAADGTTLEFQLTGMARATDANGDYELDTLTGGEWAGTLTYTATQTPLAQPATFRGERL